MLRSANELKGFSIAATDGDVGQVEAFCFDENRWTVRYIIVNTGGWLHTRKVLVSPLSVGGVDWVGRGIATDLTRQEVRASPRINTAKTVLRKYEAAYNDHFKLPHRDERVRDSRNAQASISRMRSTKDLDGFSLAATDGEAGHREDFIIDDESWTIRYLVVDTRNWLPGKKVMIAPRWIKRVDWQARSRLGIKNGFCGAAKAPKDFEIGPAESSGTTIGRDRMPAAGRKGTGVQMREFRRTFANV